MIILKTEGEKIMVWAKEQAEKEFKRLEPMLVQKHYRNVKIKLYSESQINALLDVIYGAYGKPPLCLVKVMSCDVK